MAHRLQHPRPMRTHTSLAVAATLALSGACAGESPGGGAVHAADGAAGVDARADAGADAADPTLIPVAHARELRGVWVATVYNINFPSNAGLSVEAQKAELLTMLDTMAAGGLNTVLFQVRPEGDALYESSLEPWSRFLSGTQGEHPGYDPLAFLIEEAHARSIEVHAWLNPYRAKASSSSAAVAPHVSVTMPEHVHAYGNLLWMDPGAPAVVDHSVAVVMDLVGRYDLDGIHFDDYFYPYPNGTAFPDDATYDAYLAGGGTLERDDWRRDNVNRLVERLSGEIAAARPHVRFGISPFGIYRPGIPEGITGLDQYAAIFADPVRWMQEGWLDYIAPQLYWPTTQAAQAYEPLLEWWTGVAGEGRYVFAGNYLSQLGSEEKWSVDEFRQQLTLSRSRRAAGSMGNMLYQIAPLLENRAGIGDVLRDEFYQLPALTPPVAIMRDVPVAPPVVALEGTTAHLTHPEPETLRAWVVYRDAGDQFVIDRIVPAAEASIELEPGRWAVSAAGRHAVESAGRLVDVP